MSGGWLGCLPWGWLGCLSWGWVGGLLWDWLGLAGFVTMNGAIVESAR